MFEEVSRSESVREATQKILQLEPGQKVTFAATRTPFKRAPPARAHQQQALRTNQKFLELKPLENDILASGQ